MDRSYDRQIVVAAAANVTEVFNQIGPKFTDKTGIKVVFSFGSTGDLARQIENGGPFDVFVSADTAHVDSLEKAGLTTPGTRAVYARGRLVVWIPSGSRLSLTRVEDIAAQQFERIAIAKPDVAPYGQAAVESLKQLGIWDRIQSRVVYGQSVAQTKQFVATGNAEVAFIPLALIKPGEGTYVEVDESLHQPINQALAVIRSSTKQEPAREFTEYLLSPEIQTIFSNNGYHTPGRD